MKYSVYIQSIFSLYSVYIQCEDFAKLTLMYGPNQDLTLLDIETQVGSADAELVLYYTLRQAKGGMGGGGGGAGYYGSGGGGGGGARYK